MSSVAIKHVDDDSMEKGELFDEFFATSEVGVYTSFSRIDSSNDNNINDRFSGSILLRPLAVTQKTLHNSELHLMQGHKGNYRIEVLNNNDVVPTNYIIRPVNDGLFYVRIPEGSTYKIVNNDKTKSLQLYYCQKSID